MDAKDQFIEQLKQEIEHLKEQNRTLKRERDELKGKLRTSEIERRALRKLTPTEPVLGEIFTGPTMYTKGQVMRLIEVAARETDLQLDDAAINSALRIGWNTAMVFLETYMGRVIDLLAEGDHLRGYLSGIVSRKETRLPLEAVSEVAHQIGKVLSRIDELNRDYRARAGGSIDLIDASILYQLRSAAIAFTSGEDPEAAALRAAIKSTSFKIDMASLMADLDSRRTERVALIAETVGRVYNDAKAQGKKKTREEAAELALVELGMVGEVEVATAVTYYDREQRKKRTV